jgi:hypothetical protein
MKGDGLAELPESDLTKHIMVQVSNISNKSVTNEFHLKVNINEKLSKIQEILEEENIMGFLLYQGKMIEQPSESTFAKSFVLNNHKFAVVTNDGC